MILINLIKSSPSLNTISSQSLGFVYGLPILLGGFALKYAEILPVNLVTNDKVRPKCCHASAAHGSTKCALCVCASVYVLLFVACMYVCMYAH